MAGGVLEAGLVCPPGDALPGVVESSTYLSAKHDALPAGTSAQTFSACQLADGDGWATAAGAVAENALSNSNIAPETLRIFFTKPP
ncbi:hypothetical protein AHiyo8_24030 [Arthrobacter sp. Hiyo8]|nr:hypothetical protein AHiyo8_24030 [Arthrobacter sp. Hiyo8]